MDSDLVQEVLSAESLSHPHLPLMNSMFSEGCFSCIISKHFDSNQSVLLLQLAKFSEDTLSSYTEMVSSQVLFY